VRYTCKELAIIGVFQYSQRCGNLIGEPVVQDKIILESLDARYAPNGVFNPIPAACIYNMTAQIDSAIFYVYSDLFVFNGSQNIVLPQGMRDGVLERRVGLLDRAALVSVFYGLLSVFTPGKFFRVTFDDLFWEHVNSSADWPGYFPETVLEDRMF
jgi:hypothetical protein